jgi:hypothetical protein
MPGWLSDLVHFKKLKTERAQPKRKPRPIRMKSLLDEMARKPGKASIPPQTDLMTARLAEAMRRLEPRCAANLTEEELVSLWGEELTRFYLDRIRVRPAAESGT